MSNNYTLLLSPCEISFINNLFIFSNFKLFWPLYVCLYWPYLLLDLFAEYKWLMHQKRTNFKLLCFKERL